MGEYMGRVACIPSNNFLLSRPGIQCSHRNVHAELSLGILKVSKEEMGEHIGKVACIQNNYYFFFFFFAF